MCYSILLFTPPQKKRPFSRDKVLIQKVPLNSYLYDVVPPAQMITCQFLFCGLWMFKDYYSVLEKMD